MEIRTKSEAARVILEGQVYDNQSRSLTRFSNQFGLTQHVNQLSHALFKKQAKTEGLAARYHIPVQCIGYSPTFDDTKVFRGRDTDWVLMNLAQDPLYLIHKNKLVAPQHVASHLQAITDAGIRFDALYIAHEIPAGLLRRGDKVPLELVMPPPPKQMQTRLNMLQQGVQLFWKGVRWIGIGIGAGAVAAAAAPLAVGSAVVVGGTVAGGLDPILFGLHIDHDQQVNGQPLASWHYITHWYWDA